MKANINGRYKKRGKSLNESEKKHVETVAKAVFVNPIMFRNTEVEKNPSTVATVPLPLTREAKKE